MKGCLSYLARLFGGVVILALLVLPALPVSAATWYVNPEATSSGNGTSWAEAGRTIKEGLDSANYTGGDEVLLHSGSYNATASGNNTPLSGNEIYGGLIAIFGAGSNATANWTASGYGLIANKQGTANCTVGLARYVDNPVTGVPISGDRGLYFDSWINSAANITSLGLSIDVPSAALVASPTPTFLHWTGGQWTLFSNYSISSGNVSANLTASTSPTLSQLVGKPLSFGGIARHSVYGMVDVLPYIFAGVLLVGAAAVMVAGGPSLLAVIMVAIAIIVGAVGVGLIQGMIPLL